MMDQLTNIVIYLLFLNDIDSAAIARLSIQHVVGMHRIPETMLQIVEPCR